MPIRCLALLCLVATPHLGFAQHPAKARLDTHGRVNLTDKMFAQLQWIMTWDNTPSTGSDRVDDLYLFSLGWSF